MLEYSLVCSLAHLWILNRNEDQDEEGYCEYSKGDVKYQIYVYYLCVGCYGSDKCTYEHRS